MTPGRATTRTLAAVRRALVAQHGQCKPPGPKDPFAAILWEQVGYMADDDKRGAAFRRLKREVGVTPRKILAAKPATLKSICKEGGGIAVDRRAERMQASARWVLDERGGALKRVLKEPLAWGSSCRCPRPTSSGCTGCWPTCGPRPGAPRRPPHPAMGADVGRADEPGAGDRPRPAGPTLRVARPTDDLAGLVRMYREGLGLDVLGEFADHDGFDGVMLGHPGCPWHLEFTTRRGHAAGGAPSPEHLLVLYLPDRTEWQRRIDAMRAAGFTEVPPDNPYWARRGATFADPDGYRVVLHDGPWPPAAAR